MSGADREVKVKFTTEHDGRGADEANKTIDKTAAKADGAAGGFGRLGKAATGFKGVMKRVNSAMAGFGVLALVNQIMTIVKAFKEAQKAHDDMVAAFGADNAAAGVARLKAAYEDLTKSIARTGEEVTAARENMDILIDAERRLEDAASIRREEDEVAALDRDDPLRKEKEADIRARYGQRRAETAGKRGVEDVAMQEAALRADIARLQENIAKRDAEIADLQAAAREYSGKAASSMEMSVAEQNKFSIFGRGRNWVGAQRIGIERYAGYASEYGKQASAALEGIMQGERDNEADRRAAAAAEKRLAALARQREAAFAEGDNASRSAARAAEGASAGVYEAARRRERDAADLERARAEQAGAESRRAAMEETKAAAAWRAREEERQAGQARAALDAHAANPPPSGSRTRWRETLAALQAAYDREQTEANEAARALEALGEATAKSMQAVNAKASAAASRIKALEARLGRDPHGDGEAQ